MTTRERPDDSPAIESASTWQAAQRLAEQFPNVDETALATILIDSRRAVDLFGLPRDEELEMAEKIAVERLRQALGESTAKAAARLDPERHVRQRPSPTGQAG